MKSLFLSVYDMKIFIFSTEMALKCKKIAINHILISCLVPELQLFKEILHRTSCDVITGYENGFNSEMI